MGEFVIALLLAFLSLLGFGIYKSNKLKEQKIKTQEAEAKAAIRENQMEVIHEVRE